MTTPADRVFPPPEPAFVATTQLFQRAREGDRQALEALMPRYLPRRRVGAGGRRPAGARGLLDTGDLVQETLLRTIGRLDHIEMHGPVGFQAYVRTAVMNRIR